MENFQLIWKISRFLESFRIVCKLARPSRTVQDQPTIFKTIGKTPRLFRSYHVLHTEISRKNRNILDSLASFKISWKKSGHFPNYVKSFQVVRKFHFFPEYLDQALVMKVYFCLIVIIFLNLKSRVTKHPLKKLSMSKKMWNLHSTLS